MIEKKRTVEPCRLLSTVPVRSDGGQVVRYPYQTDGDYAYAYHFAAQQLATTLRGKPEDDLLLLPFLMLYRQAFELLLKDVVKELVVLRMKYVEGRTLELVEASSEVRLKRKLGHKLGPILEEVKMHYAALSLPDDFPESVESVVLKVYEADKGGTAFRYAGLLPGVQEYADLSGLAEMLGEAFDGLCVVADYAECSYHSMPVFEDL